MATLLPDRIAELTVFDGFPYLIVRMAPAMYHVTLLPEDASEDTLVGIARAQRLANLLDVCLVLGPERALYINPSGLEWWDATPPRGGALITGQLRPPGTWPDTPHLRARRGRLNVRLSRSGFAFGDLTKGGHAASTDELARLAGAGPGGVPRGLERCPACGEWRGTCLDPSPRFAGQVMTVHCRCANDNRCAACGGLLYERKLNANYYNPRDGHIWYVPGFSGLGHRCPVAPAAGAGSGPGAARAEGTPCD
jgi:hypothetical protein